MSEPWSTKHRPLSFESVVGNVEIVARLKRMACHRSIPNLLLTGLPGTGKTTSIACLAKEIGATFRKMNASDKRNVSDVRTSITDYVSKKDHPDEKKTVRMLLLDEVDCMTAEGQRALRRVMNIYTDVVYAFACNVFDKIIPELRSQCVVLNYTRLEDAEISHRLYEIADAESIPRKSIEDDGMRAILYVSEGDMRTAINSMQSAFTAGKIDAESVYAVCGQPKEQVVASIFIAANDCSTKNAIKCVDTLFKEGYSASDIVSAMWKVCKRRREWHGYIPAVVEAYVRIQKSNTALQLYALVYSISK